MVGKKKKEELLNYTVRFFFFFFLFNIYKSYLILIKRYLNIQLI